MKKSTHKVTKKSKGECKSDKQELHKHPCKPSSMKGKKGY